MSRRRPVATLNHTSGVFDLLGDRNFVSRYVGASFFDHRFDSWTPRQLVDIATSHPPRFRRGEGWGYSNTDYILAGMVIEAATGQSYAEAVDTRILRPLGLHGTVVPGASAAVPRPHAQAYSNLFMDAPDAPMYDVTAFNPSLAGAAGEIISTTRDMNVFFRELFSGSMLPARQQRELLATVDTGRGYRYGLGVQTYERSGAEHQRQLERRPAGSGSPHRRALRITPPRGRNHPRFERVHRSKTRSLGRPGRS